MPVSRQPSPACQRPLGASSLTGVYCSSPNSIVRLVSATGYSTEQYSNLPGAAFRVVVHQIGTQHEVAPGLYAAYESGLT
jgi:hypothetical protein